MIDLYVLADAERPQDHDQTLTDEQKKVLFGQTAAVVKG